MQQVFGFFTFFIMATTMINQRSKGQRGERELFSLLSDLLGFIVKRNIDNTRGSRCDSLDIPGWSCEVKFTERLLSKHWDQALEQAAKDNRKPALFWRKKYGEWEATVRLKDIHEYYVADYPVRLSLEAFAYIVRETI
jgi:hypothetical protein